MGLCRTTIGKKSLREVKERGLEELGGKKAPARKSKKGHRGTCEDFCGGEKRTPPQGEGKYNIEGPRLDPLNTVLEQKEGSPLVNHVWEEFQSLPGSLGDLLLLKSFFRSGRGEI